MRRKFTVGVILIAVVAVSALAALADDMILKSRTIGPHFGSKMVARNDVGTASYDRSGPYVPSKPIPGPEARVGGGGRGLSGHDGPGSSTPIASASPQMQMENTLKSLAHTLR